MKTLFIPLIFSLAACTLVFASTAYAQTNSSLSPQRQKFANCAHKSKGMKGEQHRKFMSECLKGKAAATAAPAAGQASASDTKQAGSSEAKAVNRKKLTSRQKMRLCSADARDQKLKGADRKSFMKECLTSNGR